MKTSAAQRSHPAVVRCPLCGYRFDPARERACTGCPLHVDCGTVCCPHCSYSFLPTSSGKPGWLTRLWRKTWRRSAARD